jgi:hypothetical protein
MRLFRILFAVALLLVTAFCVYGFLASFEPPSFLIIRIGYAVLGMGCLIAAFWFLRQR